MPSWQRAYLATCAGIIAFALAYVAVDYARLPHLYYYQYQRTFRLGAEVRGLPAGYVGMWLWALAAGLVAAGGAWLIGRWKRTPLGERGLGLGLAWTVTATVLAVGYYTWNNWP